MKYHYQIVSQLDDIRTDSKNFMVGTSQEDEENHRGFDKIEIAQRLGEEEMQRCGLSTDNWRVRVYPVAENVEEEDILDGHAYPAHETWDDSPKTIEEYNRVNGD